jgi:hypothetical protein
MVLEDQYWFIKDYNFTCPEKPVSRQASWVQLEERCYDLDDSLSLERNSD